MLGLAWAHRPAYFHCMHAPACLSLHVARTRQAAATCGSSWEFHQPSRRGMVGVGKDGAAGLLEMQQAETCTKEKE